MYTVNGQQIRNAVLSEKERAEMKKNPLSKLRITGSNGQLLLGSVKENSRRDSFSITETLSELLNPTCGMTEEEKQAYEAKIMQKLKQGKKLTGEEMAFLQMANPMLYMQAARVQMMRESLEKQLEGCKSKEEVQQIFSSAVSHIPEADPMREEIVAAFGDAMKEYTETGSYEDLPNTQEQEKEKQEK